MTSSVSDALVGRVIDGRYRIISHLADGGMASVYVAMDARLERRVALKIMRPGLATDSLFVDRFRREAKSAARLSHPNVVAVFDQGEDAGEVFLVMELVTGKTLREVIHEEAPLTSRESLAILEPILEALRAAHEADIIHRDVKPENVLIRADGEVKVADFGLARAASTQTTTSQTGVVLGTASYLSPEQVELGTSDERSDVYAAGLLLFEMLTGRKAVTGETAIQIAYRHVHGTIEAPSQVVPAVPAALDDLVAKATATEPGDRFPDVPAFLAALRGVRGRLTAAELDRRGVAAPGPHGSPAVSHTQRMDAARPPRAAEAPVAHAAAPVLSQTTALPISGSPDERRRRRWLWPLVALLVVLVVGGGASTAWWFTAGPGGTTRIPQVTGIGVQQAESQLRSRDLRTGTTEAFSETVPKGQVIDVNPAPGTEVHKQIVVALVVSKGPERYTVPDLGGAKLDQVAAKLSGLTLKLGKSTEAWNETVPKGVVISQDPAKGTSVKRGTTVSVVVSKGREPIAVPNVAGKPWADAEAAIAGAGLAVKRADDANSDTVPAGSVISQSPAEGTLHRGDPVTVTVSKGPVMVQVPDVLGQPAAAAEKALTDLGFKVRIERPLGQFFELVRNQSVPGGQNAPKGSTIVLTVV
ncbi:MAG: Stk1 family PASTA domain-containing Ser/Thr kinase [Intrasporangium sp.]|uniref:Stk1 family PASTA domain-containing Ser/Thr kinase n=1 Tax=Intrasporangium sp. TaxID=1925024 RepID=UPI003F7E7307